MTQISPLNCMTLDLKLGSPSQKGHKKFENMLGASPNWIIRIWPNLQVTNCWESNPLPAMPKSPVSQEYCRGLLMVQPSLFNKAGLLFWAYFLARDCYFCYPLLPPRAGPPPRLYVKCIFPKFQVADAPSKMASSLSSRECFCWSLPPVTLPFSWTNKLQSHETFFVHWGWWSLHPRKATQDITVLYTKYHMPFLFQNCMFISFHFCSLFVSI